MHKGYWWLGGTLLFLLVLYLVGRTIATSKLDAALARANGEGNRLQFADRSVSFGFTHLGVRLDSVELDQRLGNRQLTGSIGRVDVNGLNLLRLLSGKAISLREVTVERPVLELRPVAPRDTSAGDGGEPTALRVDDFTLRDGTVRLLDTAGNLRLLAMGLTATAPLTYPLHPATAPALRLDLDSLRFPGQEESDLTISDTHFDATAQTLTIGTVRVTPRRTAENFLTSIPYKDNWLALRLDEVRLEELPVDSLYARRPAVLPAVRIGDLNLAVFENPTLDRDPAAGYKDFPVEQFRNLPFPALLRELTVARANISYGVCAQKTERPDITLAGSLRLRNLSTWKQEEAAVADFDLTFEESSPLQLRFVFDQAGNGRDFRATGELKDYQLTKINPLMVVAAGADIEGGYLESLVHDFSSTGEVSTGELTFRYDKLEVKMEGGVKAKFINLIEDLAIRDSNPRNDGDLVIGRVRNEHDPTKSFFNHYWKSLVSGMTSSVTAKFFVPDEKEGRHVEAPRQKKKRSR